MTGNIVGEEFDQFVVNEIKFRQQTQYSGYDDTRDFDTIKYQNNKNAWVKLASSVEISDRSYLGLDTTNALTYGPLHYEGSNKLKRIFGDNSQEFMGMELAKKAILFNGLSYAESTTEEGEVVIVEKGGEKFLEKRTITNISKLEQRYGISGKILGNEAYGIGGTEMGLQPMPGIKDVSIECVHRGSIRKANISIIAFNKKQFEIIELLYLRLGYTILLEWGNDTFYDGEKWNTVGNTLVEDFFFKEQGTTQLEVLRKIQEYRRKYRGNYDGFFGKVVNFNWEYGPSGTYNITLQLVTLGDVIESLQVNIPASTISSEEIKAQVELAKENKENITQQTISTLSETDSPIITQASKNIIGQWLFKRISNPYWWKKKQDSSYFELFQTSDTKITYFDRGPKKYYYFVTFQQLLWFIEKDIIPLIDTGGKEKVKQMHIDTSVENTRISYYPNQISFDPRICIFKYEFNGSYEVNGNKILLDGINPPEYLQNLKPYIINEGNVIYGQLMNLYLNFDFIAECSEKNTDEKGNLSLFKFFKSICSGINTALGGVNNIEPIIKDDRIITFIDQNPIQGLYGILPKKEIVDLEFYGYSPESSSANFVKDISFKTEITPDLASMITIGTTGGGSSTKNIDATAFSKWNVGLIDRFSLAVIDPNNEFNSDSKDISEEEVKYKREFETYGEIQYIEIDDDSAAINSVSYGISNKSRIDSGKRNIKYKGIIGTFTEQEYIDLRKSQVNQNIIPLEELSSQKASNYVLYLTECFGGNTNLTIAHNAIAEGSTFYGGDLYRETSKSSKFGGYTSKYSFLSPRSNYHKINPDFISRGKGIFKSHINTFNNATFKNSNPQIPSNTLGFIPVSLEIKLEGISGVKIYNKLNLNNKYLPYHYPQAFHFLITKVNHKISNNTWETSLSTLSIPNIPNDSVKSTFGSSNSTILGFNGIDLGDPPFEERGPIPSTGPFTIIENRKEDALRDKNNYGGAEQQINIDKILNEIHPDARPSFKKFFDELISKYPGYTLKVNAIGRTLQRSAELKNQNINNSSPGFSKHNYYASIDFNITDPNGNTLYKNDRYGWLKSGIPDLATKHGLRWGGNFSNYIDGVHFEYWFNINVAYKNIQTQVLGKGNEGPLRDEDFSKVDIHQISLK